MKHHVHPTRVSRWDTSQATDAASFTPHPDSLREDTLLVWFPIATEDGTSIDSLERLTCVPTRPGAVRIAAVPHVAFDVALGDEVAIGDWEGEPLARGQLASSLFATLRVVIKPEAAFDWQNLAQRLTVFDCWFDPIAERAVAIAVPRDHVIDVVDMLAAEARAGLLDWEFATSMRYAASSDEAAVATPLAVEPGATQ